MKNQTRVLIIEDHPLISEAYKNALISSSFGNKELEFCIDIADNCELAYNKIKKSLESKAFDLFFIDIKLPRFNEGKILSGEDLGLMIKELIPNSKIIINKIWKEIKITIIELNTSMNYTQEFEEP